MAAAAELAGIPLIHCERGFERIAAVSGQPLEMIGRPGNGRAVERPYVVLEQADGDWTEKGEVTAISPASALEEAARRGLLGPGRSVAVDRRQWEPTEVKPTVG